MNRSKIYLSLYILIPIIFSGITIITVILTYLITLNYTGSDFLPIPYPITFWIFFISILTFICTFFILNIILNPVSKFIKKAESIPLLQKQKDGFKNIKTDVDPSRMAHFFEQVTDILSHVEARELFPDIIGHSKLMRGIFSQIVKVSQTDSTVLITGESGTGKELIARHVYEHSRRKGKPFIKLNCVAIPEGLLESELFGHEKGSFTGAITQKIGKFELANEGTIFLDEIGDMPLSTQAKILRALQEREFERVGGTKSIKIDVRFIIATNKDLLKMVKEGKFREDLYYRLNVFPIHLPPLRDRREDIPMLADYFLGKTMKSAKLSAEALQLLIGYSWPGNIRELKNALDRAIVMAEDAGVIDTNHLPQILRELSQPPLDFQNLSLDNHLNEIEKRLIIESLNRAAGIQTKAAHFLGINQRSLWHRIKKFGIDIQSFKHLQIL
jgi:transcriptional regulator with GAF, ATPase, and Fis domain